MGAPRVRKFFLFLQTNEKLLFLLAVERKFGDEGAVQAAVAQERHTQGEDLRNGVAPPHQIVVAGVVADLSQNKGRRDQQHKLPDEGHDEGVYGLAQRLKAAA